MKVDKQNRVLYNVRLRPELLKDLRKIAKQNQVSVSDEIRKRLRESVEFDHIMYGGVSSNKLAKLL